MVKFVITLKGKDKVKKGCRNCMRGFITSTLYQIQRAQIMEDEMKATRIYVSWSKKLNGRDLLRDLEIEGPVILKCVLKK
jgi:hypothetical protein